MAMLLLMSDHGNVPRSSRKQLSEAALGSKSRKQLSKAALESSAPKQLSKAGAPRRSDAALPLPPGGMSDSDPIDSR